ncbi:hypothetical protein L1987_40368 [Smallanthus sonchifolius]|uniref:Uncharacterized protein n=1 Tax=Smallanthus sonchifolius TaxID=185202 RepID=A0ACB9GSW1_9ASTR|nr:hypothetical protein L1987_40368 [Smallanthus sonchifolius]
MVVSGGHNGFMAVHGGGDRLKPHDPVIFNVSDDEAEVEPDVLKAGDESELESDYEEDPKEMADVEHEALEPEVDPEVVADEEPEAPMEAQPGMEAGETDSPPRKRKLAPVFGEEDTVPPPPPKRARDADIVEDDDISDEEPPSNFKVGGTS